MGLIKKDNQMRIETNFHKAIVTRNLFIIATIFLLTISNEDLLFSFYFSALPFLDTVAFMIPLAISALLLLTEERIKLDIVALLLTSRIIFAFLTILKANVDIYSAGKSFVIFITALFSYLIMKNHAKNINKNSFNLIISIFFIIISIQTIAVYLNLYKEGYSYFKDFIEIPIGKSNYIATNLLIGAVYLLYTKQKSVLNYFSLTVSLIAILLTLSFGAIIAFVGVAFLNYWRNLRNNNLKKPLFFLLVICFCIGLYSYYLNYNPSPDKMLNEVNEFIATKINYLHNGNFEKLSSGRIELFKRAVDNFSKNILLGNYYGVKFREDSDFKTHNLFLEGLSSYGILGFITLVVPIFWVLNITRKNIKNNVLLLKPIYLTLLAGVIHGLIEPNFYALSFEFLWWSIAGYGVGVIKANRKIRICDDANSKNERHNSSRYGTGFIP